MSTYEILLILWIGIAGVGFFGSVQDERALWEICARRLWRVDRCACELDCDGDACFVGVSGDLFYGSG